MKQNMGNFDRIFRSLIAIAIIVLYLNNMITGTWAIVLLVIAGIFLLTSIMGFCPLYTLFRIRTTGRKEEKAIS
jgi:hypothetical protein